MTDAPQPDVLKPSVGVLCKLGSIAVHAEEGLGPHGHEFDITTLKGLLEDPEVRDWIEGMHKLALLPVTRGGGKKRGR